METIEDYEMKTWDVSSDEVNSIFISDKINKVNIYSNDELKIKAEYYIDTKRRYDFEILNGELSIEFHTDIKRIENLKGLNLNIYIPRKYNGRIKIKTVSGNIYFKDNSFEKNVSINTISGNILMENVELKKDLNLCNISGQINLEKTSIENVLTINTTSGNVYINMLNKCNYLINSISGDINALVSGGQPDYRILCNTISGRMNVTDTTDGIFEANISNISGNVNLQFSN